MKRFAVVGAIGLVLLACAVAAVPWLARTDGARRAIERQVAEALGGEVQYEALVLRLLPRPNVEIRNVVVRIPGVIEARAATLRMHLALLELLAGDVRPTALRIEQLVAELRVQARGGGDAFAAYRAAIGPAIEALVRRATGMTVSVVEGRLDVVYAGRRVVALSELAAEATVSSDAIAVDASGAADSWRKAQGRARIAAGELAATASLQVTGLRAGELPAGNDETAALRMLPGAVDATVAVETDGRTMVRAAATFATPQFIIVRGARQRELGAVRAAGEILYDAKGFIGTLRELKVGELVRGASGVVRATRDSAAPEFEFKVPMLDMAQLHSAVLALDVDYPAVRPLLAFVSAGIVHDLSASGAWLTMMSEFTQSLRAEARLEAATIAVPAAGIVVRKGSGHFVLADGVLQGTELMGEIGRSTFSAGALALELRDAGRLTSLRAALNADLADALALARHLLKERSPPVVAGIETLAGRATGSVNYDARRRVSPLVLELLKVRATGRHRSMPFPLEVNRADLRYSGAGVSVRGLAASAGRSSVREGNIEIAFGTAPEIRAASGETALFLDETYPWLRSFEALRPALGELESVTGTARVRLARLHGPLTRPVALDIEAAIEPRDVRIQARALPAPLLLTAGVGELTRRTLKLNRVAVASGDTQFIVSGTVYDYAAAGRHADLEFSQGTVGQRGMDWIRTRLRLPAEGLPRAPLDIASTRMQWSGVEKNAVSAQGRLRVGGAVDVDFDAEWRSGDIDLRRLALKDADTDLNAALRWKQGAVDVSFNGTLDSRTFARMLVHPPADRGAVRGNFRAAVDVHEPQRSSATGTAEGEGIALAGRFGIPFALEKFRLEAAERVLRVHESTLVVGGQRMEVSGTVEGRQETFAVAARVAAKALDAQRLLDGIARKPDLGVPRPLGSVLWDLPLSGRIMVAAESLTLGRHVLQQVEGSVELAPKRIAADVTNATLCGIMVPFTAALTPSGVEARARLQARGQALEHTLPCLAEDRLAITGTFDLDAELTARGSAGALGDSARGTFRFAARKGRIHQAALVTRAIAIDEVATRLEADPPKLMAGGLEYGEIAVAGSIEAGRMRVDHGMLDSPRLGLTVSGDVALADGGLALQGLVAPFDTVHQALRRVPVLGRAVGASLVVVPVSISGTLSEPQFRVLAAAAVGATLINFMTARFLLPIDLLDISGARPAPKP